MLICEDGSEASPEEIAAMPEFVGWHAGLERRGIEHQGVRLRPAREAVTLKVRDGQVVVTDGPFAETKEQIGGFELVVCDDLDDAIEIAAGHPAASRSSIEIRPYWEDQA
jgi:hypothetical protein